MLLYSPTGKSAHAHGYFTSGHTVGSVIICFGRISTDYHWDRNWNCHL